MAPANRTLADYLLKLSQELVDDLTNPAKAATFNPSQFYLRAVYHAGMTHACLMEMKEKAERADKSALHDLILFDRGMIDPATIVSIELRGPYAPPADFKSLGDHAAITLAGSVAKYQVSTPVWVTIRDYLTECRTVKILE